MNLNVFDLFDHDHYLKFYILLLPAKCIYYEKH